MHDAGQGFARSGVHGQRRADLRQRGGAGPVSASAAAEEEAYDRQWFEEHGFEVRPLKSETFLEGAGDALSAATRSSRAIASAATSAGIRS